MSNESLFTSLSTSLSTSTSAEKLNINLIIDCNKNELDDIMCYKYLSENLHYIYVSVDTNGAALFIIATMNNNNNICGRMIDKYDSYDFIIDNYLSKHTSKAIKKVLQNKIVSQKLKTVFANVELTSELINFCKKFSFESTKLDIGIIYVKHNQIDTDTIFSNDYKNASKDYKQFLQLLNVPDIFDETTTFDDVFNDSVKIRWYPGTHMDTDQIRQYIGNTQCVILYHDDDVSKETILNIFGKVTRIFVCVTKNNQFNNKFNNRIDSRFDQDIYKINIIHKTTSELHPMTDSHVVRKRDSVYDEILKQININMIQLKKKSEISYLYTLPREVALNKIKTKFANS